MSRHGSDRILAAVVTALLLAACGDVDGTERAETRLTQYRHDPLTSPVDIGLTMSDPPDDEIEQRPELDTPPPGGPGHDDLQITYWFEVPAGSDREALLDLAATDLIERGWELLVANDEIRMLTSSPSTDDLRATIILDEPGGDRLVQEIRIQH